MSITGKHQGGSVFKTLPPLDSRCVGTDVVPLESMPSPTTLRFTVDILCRTVCTVNLSDTYRRSMGTPVITKSEPSFMLTRNTSRRVGSPPKEVSTDTPIAPSPCPKSM